jgi:1-acyl-sn-glycerol-3-phosphate acyltransferase
MRLIRQLIGIVTLALVAILFVAGDIYGRIAVELPARRWPGRYERLLRNHFCRMRRAIFFILRHVGRARFDIAPVIPCRGGILVVMNHQSLIDIPVGSAMVPDGYPRFVTAARYAKGIPSVSHVIRMIRAITVSPGRTGHHELERLMEAGRTAEHPIILFPEGHRTKDGEIRPWKRGALDALLSTRTWTIHVVVLDGLWNCARIPDFIRTITEVRCRVESAGVFEYDGRGAASHDELVSRMHAAMCDKLSEMRRLARSGTRAA